MIYFTSDLHFNELRNFHYFEPFLNLNQKNNTIINNWNKIIKKDDLIYILGDIGDCRFLEYLNGKIIVILGNHDRYFINDKFKGNLEYYKNYLKRINKNISLSKHINFDQIQLKNNFKLLLVHEPNLRHNLNFTNFNFLIFGHIHDLVKLKSYGINAGCMNYNYQPINLNDVIYFYNGIKNGLFHSDVFN